MDPNKTTHTLLTDFTHTSYEVWRKPRLFKMILPNMVAATLHAEPEDFWYGTDKKSSVSPLANDNDNLRALIESQKNSASPTHQSLVF